MRIFILVFFITVLFLGELNPLLASCVIGFYFLWQAYRPYKIVFDFSVIILTLISCCIWWMNLSSPKCWIGKGKVRVLEPSRTWGDGYACLVELDSKDRVWLLDSPRPLALGEELWVTGAVLMPEVKDEQAFSMRKFLWSKGCLSYLEVAQVQNQPEIIGLLPKGRNILVNYLDGRCSEDLFPVVMGVVFGDGSYLDAAQSDTYRQTGVTHVLVASGANIAIVVGMWSFLARYCRAPDILVHLGGLASAWTYFLFVGSGVSLERALWVYTLGVMLLTLGHWKNPKQVFWVGGSLLLLLNPGSALDAGFLLSFAAVFGILYLGIPLAHLWGGCRFITLIFSLTLGTYMGVSFIELLIFGTIHLGTPLVNLVLAVPFELILPGTCVAMVDPTGLTFHALESLVSGIHFCLSSFRDYCYVLELTGRVRLLVLLSYGVVLTAVVSWLNVIGVKYFRMGNE